MSTFGMVHVYVICCCRLGARTEWQRGRHVTWRRHCSPQASVDDKRVALLTTRNPSRALRSGWPPCPDCVRAWHAVRRMHGLWQSVIEWLGRPWEGAEMGNGVVHTGNPEAQPLRGEWHKGAAMMLASNVAGSATLQTHTSRHKSASVARRPIATCAFAARQRWKGVGSCSPRVPESDVVIKPGVVFPVRRAHVVDANRGHSHGGCQQGCCHLAGARVELPDQGQALFVAKLVSQDQPIDQDGRNQGELLRSPAPLWLLFLFCPNVPCQRAHYCLLHHTYISVAKCCNTLLCGLVGRAVETREVHSL